MTSRDADRRARRRLEKKPASEPSEVLAQRVASRGSVPRDPVTGQLDLFAELSAPPQP